MNGQIFLGLNERELRILESHLLRAEPLAQISGIEFHQQVALVHVDAFGHDADDARDPFQLRAYRHLMHRLERAALDNGNQKVIPFDGVIGVLRRVGPAEAVDHPARDQSQCQGAGRCDTRPRPDLVPGGLQSRLNIFGGLHVFNFLNVDHSF